MTENRTNTKPALSVVVVIFGGRASLPSCIDVLLDPAGLDGLEIIVPIDDRIPDPDELRAQYPSVQWVPVQGKRTYAELRAIVVGCSSGDIVAITEAQCVPAPDWKARILQEHDSDHAVIGGAVEKRFGTALSWAMYLHDYGRYMNPVQEGLADYLTDCNVSYKRWILDATAPLWAKEFHETTIHWKLLESDQKLWFSPGIVVEHQRLLGLKEAIQDRYAFGRLFASTRVTAVSPLKRWGYAATAWLLPPVLCWRALTNVIRKRRHVGQCVRALPWLVITTTAWAFGELVGYMTGRAGESLSPSSQDSDPPVSPGCETKP